jgi:hypothetical protein
VLILKGDEIDSHSLQIVETDPDSSKSVKQEVQDNNLTTSDEMFRNQYLDNGIVSEVLNHGTLVGNQISEHPFGVSYSSEFDAPIVFMDNLRESSGNIENLNLNLFPEDNYGKSFEITTASNGQKVVSFIQEDRSIFISRDLNGDNVIIIKEVGEEPIIKTIGQDRNEEFARYIARLGEITEVSSGGEHRFGDDPLGSTSVEPNIDFVAIESQIKS